MRTTCAIALFCAAALAAAAVCAPALVADAPLRLLRRIDVPGFEGDFDHFATDIKGNRLFLAGEDKGTLEVFDLKSGTHVRTVNGLEAPHAIHYMPGKDRLLITNSGEGLTKVLDGRTYKVVDTIRLAPGADVLGYDASTRRAWIVTGGKNAGTKLGHTIVSVIDPVTGARFGDVQFDTDFTEGIAAERNGSRVFINVAGMNSVAVVDKTSLKVTAMWPVREGDNNAPIALDEAGHRLFVVTRKPFRFVAIDTLTGASVASLEAPPRTNELVYDRANRRIYLTGDDYISVIRQDGADKYGEIARIKSDKGAKTALLVPELDLLYVAVAGNGTTTAGVLQYAVLPSR